MRNLMLMLLALAALVAGVLSFGAESAAQEDESGDGEEADELTEEDKALATKAYFILRNNCWSCHGEPGREHYGETTPLDWILDYDKLVEHKVITPGEAGKSRLIRLILTDDMPRALDENGSPSKRADLAEGELETLIEWIKAGAPEWRDYSRYQEGLEWRYVNKSDPEYSLPQWRAVTRGPNDTLVAIRRDSWKEGGQTQHIWKDGSWKKVDVKGTPANPNEVAIWNPTAKRSVFFTKGSNGRLAVDEWDGERWEHIESGSAPLWSHGFTAAWNPDRETVQVFGGFVALSEAEQEQHPGMTSRAVNEYWEFNGEAWSQIECESLPPPAKAYVMAYDKERETMLMFERQGAVVSVLGVEDSPEQVRAWEFSDGNWQERQPIWSPPSKHAYAAAWCAELNAVVVGGTEHSRHSEFTDQMHFYAWSGKVWHALPIRPLPADEGREYWTLGSPDLIEWQGSVLLTGGVIVGNTEPDSVYKLVPADD